jgi:hypothetical protein
VTQTKPDLDYQEIVERRRALVIALQIVGRGGIRRGGPVLVALHWLDESSILGEWPTLQELGYLPNIQFNTVIDAALARSGFEQIGHLRQPNLPSCSPEALTADFTSRNQVTRFELQGRKVIAQGDNAAAECARHAIEDKNATELGDAIAALGFGRAVKENPSTG